MTYKVTSSCVRLKLDQSQRYNNSDLMIFPLPLAMLFLARKKLDLFGVIFNSLLYYKQKEYVLRSILYNMKSAQMSNDREMNCPPNTLQFDSRFITKATNGNILVNLLLSN